MSSVSLHSRWGQREELLDMERCSVSPGQSRRRGWSIRRDQSSPECLEWLLAGAGPKSCLFCLKTQPELQGHSGRAPASPFPIKPGEADGCSLCPAGMPRDGPCCSTRDPFLPWQWICWDHWYSKTALHHQGWCNSIRGWNFSLKKGFGRDVAAWRGQTQPLCTW